MKIQEVKVIYESDNIEKYKKLISDKFYELGVQGLKIEEPLKEKNPLDYYSDDKLFLNQDNAISAYFPLNFYAEKRKKIILEKFNENFLEDDDIIYTVEFFEHDNEDYENNWKNYLFPEKVSEKFVIKPSWREYTPLDDELVIELDPGKAFGTGSHPTTSLALRLLEENLKEGETVIDIGTGTGILMIAAKKLGASKVYGTDIDELAIESAEENLILNNIDMKDIKLLKGDLLTVLDGEKFDVVIANILPDVLVLLLSSISKILNPKAKIIFSGILTEKSELIIGKVKKMGYEVVEIKEINEWSGLLIKTD